MQLPLGCRTAEVGMDDHRHQGRRKARQRGSGARTVQARVDHGEHCANDSLRREGRRLLAPPDLAARLIDSGDQRVNDPRTALQCARPRAKRLHDAQPRERGLLVEEAEQRGEPRADPLAPACLPPAMGGPRTGAPRGLISGQHDRGSARDRLVERCQQALLAV